MLCFPTQLLIHGQWWSYCSIHVSQVSQWFDLLGLYWMHLKQIEFVSLFNELKFEVDELIIVLSFPSYCEADYFFSHKFKNLS